MDTVRRLVPQPPLLAAGALGGPFVIGSLTPLRNVMSNAAQDQQSTFLQLYRKVIGSPSLSAVQQLRVAYTGALVSVPPACPQWCMIGPFFHLLHTVLPTPAAILGTACLETSITFGSQTRNVQMAYNVQAPKTPVPLSPIIRPWGPGAPFYVLRNCCGMAGIRWFSPPLQNMLQPVLPSGPREVVADMTACMATCVASAPLNACWSYTVTTPAMWSMGFPARVAAITSFLRTQYLDSTGTRLSRLAMRDLGVRCVYVSCCFTMFRGIERLSMKHLPIRHW